jgi:sulfur carrier protein
MQLTVNGEAKTFPDGLTVRGLVEALALTEGPVAVERNREVVPRALHTDTVLADQDVVEIVHLVGGG